MCEMSFSLRESLQSNIKFLEMKIFKQFSIIFLYCSPLHDEIVDLSISLSIFLFLSLSFPLSHIHRISIDTLEIKCRRWVVVVIPFLLLHTCFFSSSLLRCSSDAQHLNKCMFDIVKNYHCHRRCLIGVMIMIVFHPSQLVYVRLCVRDRVYEEG
jgi:hypothetical protein